ncbi:MAG: hypothetical protein E5W94_27945 [Mesorhizobium sp.]|nr:MAG: hypothetical protein E5W94_27945 [Mesorhizobium sp.]
MSDAVYMQGKLHLALLRWAQAFGSIGWVTAQQDLRKKIAEKLKIGPEAVERLEIHPKGKAAIRWSAIVLGIAVPTLVLIFEELLSDGDKVERDNILNWTYEGMEAL